MVKRGLLFKSDLSRRIFKPDLNRLGDDSAAEHLGHLIIRVKINPVWSSFGNFRNFWFDCLWRKIATAWLQDQPSWFATSSRTWHVTICSIIRMRQSWERRCFVFNQSNLSRWQPVKCLLDASSSSPTSYCSPLAINLPFPIRLAVSPSASLLFLSFASSSLLPRQEELAKLQANRIANYNNNNEIHLISFKQGGARGPCLVLPDLCWLIRNCLHSFVRSFVHSFIQ